MQDPVVVDALQVREALRNIVDPEIGINIVDLGLVYAVEADRQTVRVRMTMTTPSCPMGGMLAEEVRALIRQRFPAATVDVDLVWDPPWQPDMMSPAARSQLGVRR
ncbi:MAG: metal-sulfur cluster assembly factor [Nevskiales bacterium]